MFIGFCVALLVAFAIPSLRSVITSSHECWASFWRPAYLRRRARG